MDILSRYSVIPTVHLGGGVGCYGFGPEFGRMVSMVERFGSFRFFQDLPLIELDPIDTQVPILPSHISNFISH